MIFFKQQQYAYMQQQQQQQRVPQPQQSPGSSWHTPQGMNMTPASSQSMSGQDNSFKIRIPGMMGGQVQTKPDPDIIDLDSDGAPIIPPSNNTSSSMSSSSSSSTNNNPNQVNHSNSATSTPGTR